MKISAQVKPINIDAAISGIMDSVPFQQAFVDRIEELRDNAANANFAYIGRKVPFDTFVNGQPGEIDDITFPGNITFVFRWAMPLALEIKDTLQRIAPVLKGRYRNSFRLLVNGDEVDWEANTVIPDDAEILITNVQPYARKLEIRAPDGIMEGVGTAARWEYKNFADIRFQYMQLEPPAWIVRDTGKPVPHPAIRITPANRFAAYKTPRAQRHSRGKKRK